MCVIEHDEKDGCTVAITIRYRETLNVPKNGRGRKIAERHLLHVTEVVQSCGGFSLITLERSQPSPRPLASCLFAMNAFHKAWSKCYVF